MGSPITLKGGGYRGLVSAVVFHAVLEMERPWPYPTERQGAVGRRRSKIQATVWLGSSAATTWLDYLGLDQLAVLEARDWPGHAREILERRPTELRIDWAALLEAGVAYFDGKSGQ